MRSTLRLLKYSRSDRLPRMLGEILQLIAQSLPESRLLQWLQAVAGQRQVTLIDVIGPVN